MSEIAEVSDHGLLIVWLTKAGLPVDQIAQRLNCSQRDVVRVLKEKEIASPFRAPWDSGFNWNFTFRVYLNISIHCTETNRETIYDEQNPERRWNDHGRHQAELECQFLNILEESLEIPTDFWVTQTAAWHDMINSSANRTSLAAEIHWLGRVLIYAPTVRQAFANAVRDGQSRNPNSPKSLDRLVTTFLGRQHETFTIAFQREPDLPNLINNQFKIWSATEALGQQQRSSLIERDFEIFCYQLGIFGYDRLETNVAIGQKFGITGSRVAEIEKKIHRKFRHPLRWPAFINLTWGLEPRQLFFW